MRSSARGFSSPGKGRCWEHQRGGLDIGAMLRAPLQDVPSFRLGFGHPRGWRRELAAPHPEIPPGMTVSGLGQRRAGGGNLGLPCWRLSVGFVGTCSPIRHPVPRPAPLSLPPNLSFSSRGQAEPTQPTQEVFSGCRQEQRTQIPPLAEGTAPTVLSSVLGVWAVGLGCVGPSGRTQPY